MAARNLSISQIQDEMYNSLFDAIDAGKIFTSPDHPLVHEVCDLVTVAIGNSVSIGIRSFIPHSDIGLDPDNTWQSVFERELAQRLDALNQDELEAGVIDFHAPDFPRILWDTITHAPESFDPKVMGTQFPYVPIRISPEQAQGIVKEQLRDAFLDMYGIKWRADADRHIRSLRNRFFGVLLTAAEREIASATLAMPDDVPLSVVHHAVYRAVHQHFQGRHLDQVMELAKLAVDDTWFLSDTPLTIRIPAESSRVVGNVLAYHFETTAKHRALVIERV